MITSVVDTTKISPMVSPSLRAVQQDVPQYRGEMTRWAMRGLFGTLLYVRYERVVAPDDVRDSDSKQQVLQTATAVREVQCCCGRIDNDRNRRRKSERGNASRRITGDGNDISGIGRARIEYRCGLCQGDRGRSDSCHWLSLRRKCPHHQ